MKPRPDCLGVFAENSSAFLDDLHHLHIAAGCGFKHNRGQDCDLRFVRRLCPANELIKIVQRKRVQNFRGELHLLAMQVVFTQDQAQRLNDKKVSAAGVAENVSPTAGSLDPIAAPPSDCRATSSTYDYYRALFGRGGTRL